MHHLEKYKDQLQIEGALTGMHFNLTVLNGLTTQQCLDKAKNNKLKLEIYNYDDIPSEYPKFILGFGGINNVNLQIMLKLSSTR